MSRTLLRLAVPVALAALFGPATVVPALADTGGGSVVVTPSDPLGRNGPPKVGVGVARPGHSGGPVVAVSSGSGGSGLVCVYTEEAGLEAGAAGLGLGGAPPAGARLYSVMCGGVSAGFVWLDPAGVPGAGVSAAALGWRAYRELGLVAPVIRTSPPAWVAQLVRVPTWLWVDGGVWVPRSATARVPGLSATATARPTQVTWSMGDGSVVVCAGPGSRYVPGRSDAYAGSPDCGHTYTRAGRYALTATVAWQVSWAGGGTGGVLPDLYSQAAVPLGVVEAQAVNR
jgi:hypothetical protein